MDELDVISLDDAKDHLVVDLTDIYYDKQITGLIKTAIALVEQYTGYRLYERDETINMLSYCENITTYPITINNVIQNEIEQLYIVRFSSLSINVECQSWCNSIINVTVGYSDPTLIPHPLISASYKMITYLFENKDAYSTTLPMDVQLMINQFRRSASI